MRPLRIDEPGMYHHVTNRGRNKQTVYPDDSDRTLFLDHLSISVAMCKIEVHAYALMDTHYHLLIRSLQGRLSEAMQGLGSRYTQDHHARHGTDGALFKGRFYSKVIDSEGYLGEATRYIVNNPVKAGIVGRPEDYIWSSYRATLGLEPAPMFLNANGVLIEYFDGDRNALAGFVNERTSAEGNFYRHVIERRDNEQLLSADRQEATDRSCRLLELARQKPGLISSVRAVSEFVCSAFDITIHDVLAPRTSSELEARDLLMTVICVQGIAETAELADAFCISDSVVRRRLSASRKRVTNEKGWESLVATGVAMVPLAI
jgi:REP element-mobilizing transposase RayT